MNDQAALADINMLSLYFELKKDKKADLEVVATAALKWVAALKAASYALDPNISVKVELVDANEGSLRLNTLLDWIDLEWDKVKTTANKYPLLSALAIALSVFIADHSFDIYDHFFAETPQVELSDTDKKHLHELTSAIQKNTEAQETKNAFFRTLERDPTITGVGITHKNTETPKYVIPSTQFPFLGGLFQLEQEIHDKRTTRQELEVTLISPTLVNKPRKWRFQMQGFPEFNAKMEDLKFLAALNHDNISENLRTGIHMTIRLRTEEEFIDGEWTPKKRFVEKVIFPNVD